MDGGQAEILRLAERVLASDIADLPARERAVVERTAERGTVARPMHRAYDQSLTVGQRLADRVAAIGGSWGFISGFALFLLGWAASIDSSKLRKI
jgi:uncharacterized membrane protein